MRTARAFTKKDLIVVVCCVAFVVMNLGIIAPGGRQRAKEAVCLSHLRQWGVIFEMYADDYDGKLMDDNYYEVPAGTVWITHAWVRLMYPYYRTFDICLCPATARTWRDRIFTGPFVGWDFRAFTDDPFIAAEADDWYLIEGQWAYGSYGKNPFCSEPSADLVDNEYFPYDHHFQTVQVKNANQIPLFGDCNYTGGFPHVHDEPAPFRYHGPVDIPNEINRWNLDRHKLSINLLFLDWSVRKFGLKQLWQLRWSKEIGWGDLRIVPDPEDPTDWPEWMRDFKN
jgi:hypothetical protein